MVFELYYCESFPELKRNILIPSKKKKNGERLYKIMNFVIKYTKLSRFLP